ncbi:UDP-galactopyranose mutase [Marinobacterium sp. D7]|uniref:UDP-galactopyranose mutase n=1 Tax=Marinobacterium ramblicola TaxID=2849041 RepID=UPI001C2D6A42|nr:UDP-galactopyranose mutase [Marinobacterium ramblicola]
MSYQAIVVGAGISGAVMAERMASQLGWKVLVLDQRPHIGGNCYDEIDENGIRIHRYGPHLFHTDNTVVWEYLSQFTQWVEYEHRVLSHIDGQLVPIPFNLTSIERCFEPAKAICIIEALVDRFGEGARIPILNLRQEHTPLLRELAEFVYDKAFVNYTSKQWGVPPEDISPEVTARVPVVVSRDDRYFVDSWQALPSEGYTEVFRRMLDHPLIDIELGISMETKLSLDWEGQRLFLKHEGDTIPFHGKVIYTGMIDQLFACDAGALTYRSLRFDFKTIAQPYLQPVTTVNYPNEHAYTRITEFKHLMFDGSRSSNTVVVYEYPKPFEADKGDEPYYPVFTEEARLAYERYMNRVEEMPGLMCVGRLAQYRYFDMDDAVSNALSSFETLCNEL